MKTVKSGLGRTALWWDTIVGIPGTALSAPGPSAHIPCRNTQFRRRPGVPPIPMTKTQTETGSASEAYAEEVTEAHLQLLLKLGTATVYEAQGQRGSIAAQIRPVDPAMKLIGTALTVDTSPGDN